MYYISLSKYSVEVMVSANKDSFPIHLWYLDGWWHLSAWVLKNGELIKINIFRIISKYFKTACPLNFRCSWKKLDNLELETNFKVEEKSILKNDYPANKVEKHLLILCKKKIAAIGSFHKPLLQSPPAVTLSTAEMFGSMEEHMVETDPLCLLVHFYSHFNVLKKQLGLSNPETRKLFLSLCFALDYKLQLKIFIWLDHLLGVLSRWNL